MPKNLEAITLRRDKPFRKWDLLYIKSERGYAIGDYGYCSLHYKGGHSERLGYSIGVIMKRLPWLLQTHRSFAVNPSYINSFRFHAKHQGKVVGYVTVGTGDAKEKFPITQLRAKAVREKLDVLTFNRPKPANEQLPTQNTHQ